MHKIFGAKTDMPYLTRKGAYLIPFKNEKIGVVKTSKGLFLLGGGLESNETHIQCIQRECKEEIGFEVTVGKCICSAEMYTKHPILGYFHPVQTYYEGILIKQIQSPVEKDHLLVWMDYRELKNNMFAQMQNWALEQWWVLHQKGMDHHRFYDEHNKAN